jgi:hypothetical protein
MTPTTPPTLARYREPHVIEPVKDWDDDLGGFYWRCRHDGLRLYPRQGGFIHAPDEIKGLAAIERGEGLAW